MCQETSKGWEEWWWNMRMRIPVVAVPLFFDCPGWSSRWFLGLSISLCLGSLVPYEVVRALRKRLKLQGAVSGPGTYCIARASRGVGLHTHYCFVWLV